MHNFSINQLKATVNRRAPVLLFDVVSHGINTRDQKEILGMPFGLDYYVSFNGEVFVLTKEYERIEEFFLEAYQQEDFSYLPTLLDRWEAIKTECLEYCSQVDIDFYDLYQKLHKLSSYLYIPICAGDAYEKYLRQFDLSDSELHALASPIRRNLESEEWRNFLKVVSAPDERNIRDHVQSFGWMNAKYFERDPFTEDNVRERIRSYADDAAQKLNDLDSEEKSTEKIIKKVIENGQLSEEVVQFGREIIWLRNDRADVTTQVGVLLRPYWTKIANEHGLGYSDMLYMTLDEIKTLLTKGVVPDIAERRQYYCYENVSGVTSVSQKKKPEDELGDVESFSGNIAYKGVVTGVARIVLQDTDIDCIQEGDVLVATMTLPSYVLGMQKAAAIVTNDGGITCHAAIVARELHKPCIIGTKIATKVLKDGMKVEVNAD